MFYSRILSKDNLVGIKHVVSNELECDPSIFDNSLYGFKMSLLLLVGRSYMFILTNIPSGQALFLK